MSSIFWYNCLAVIGAGIIVFTMYKKRNIADLFSFFLFATTLSWLAELFILFLFEGYAYKPGLFTDPWANNIIGHIIPNTSLWSTAAVLVGAFSLRYRWIFLISVAYMLIEILFLKLGIYEHYWWRTYMTGIATFIFMSIMKIWFSKLNEKRHKFLRNITFFFIALVIIHTPTILLLLLGRQHYSVDWFSNMYRDSTVFAATYHIGMAFIFTLFICILKKWYWKPVPILIFLLGDSILLNMNILIFQDGWNFFYLTLVRIIGVAIFLLLEKHSLLMVAGNDSIDQQQDGFCSKVSTFSHLQPAASKPLSNDDKSDE